MTEAGTDDATHNGAVRREPIGEHDGQRNRICQAERHDAALPVVPPRIIEFDVGRREDLARELESALGQVPVALRGIPVVGHGCNLRLCIHRHKGAGPYNENAFCCIATARKLILLTDRGSQCQQQRGLGSTPH